MNEFQAGQRWISNTELQLGLGMVTASDFRTVTIVFPASEEVRTYAIQSAHLTRVEFVAGDTITSNEDTEMTVESVINEDGLLIYVGSTPDGTPQVLEETKLDHFLQLNRPVDRLFSGQLDHPKLFRLREETLKHNTSIGQSDINGLTGGRTALIAHQLYVANEVARRYAPRVLLADEVGLGKTIEAGMILHSQLLSQRIKRVLIVVPETLLHQWLIEMRRRFNLPFGLFNQARVDSLLESDPELNPFESEQLVLCPLHLLTESADTLDQAVSCHWDMLVVDEAHHLQWSQKSSSPEYQCIEQLANVIQGVLLLTATPEQLGKEGHFARLRLLDPQRFPDLGDFITEEQSYEPIAQAIKELIANTPLSKSAINTLHDTIREGDNQQLLTALQEDDNEAARTELIQHLLDRHGTGRVLFRNTRATVKGFPARQLQTVALPLPDAYQMVLKSIQTETVTDHQQLLSLETLYQNRAASEAESSDSAWYDIDPRVHWLLETLKSIAPERALLITSSAETAMDLFEVLRVKSGIHAAVFHEQMTLIERDRAAAYFADSEEGTQVLLCSEIGSEGRNFQFAHHLILFDLPLNPDLLEQRIGRLDRIGQSRDIQIHVPYIQSTPQQAMLRWYEQGLDAFSQPCPAGHSVFSQLYDELVETLHQSDAGLEDLQTLIDTTSVIHKRLTEQLQQGRDQLLEYNSCRADEAEALLEAASQEENVTSLKDYLEQAFDAFGVDFEDDTETSYIIHPGQHMLTDSIPGLPEEGMTATFERDVALSNEDMQFLSWAHPLVTGSMDLVLSGEYGNTAFTSIKHPGLAQGTILVECLFILETATTEASRYLPATTMRLVVNKRGMDLAAKLPSALIEKLHEKVKFDIARRIIKACQDDLRPIISEAEKLAKAQAPALIQTALHKAHQEIGGEIERLEALSKINKNVRNEEIDHYKQHLEVTTQTLQKAAIRLDAIQVIVVA